MCSYAAETRFGRNGRQRKSSPERGGNDLLWDCLLLVSYHIGTLKSSKLVVNYGKIVVFRGFREQIGANSGSAVADKKNLVHVALHLSESKIFFQLSFHCIAKADMEQGFAFSIDFSSSVVYHKDIAYIFQHIRNNLHWRNLL